MKLPRLLVLSFFTMLFGPAARASALLDLFSVDFHTKNVYDGKELDVDYSQMRFSFGSRDITFRQYLDEYVKNGKSDIDGMWEFTLGISLVPFVAKDTAEKKLGASVDEKIAYLHEQANLQIPALASQALRKFFNANPQLEAAYLASDPTAIATVQAVEHQIRDTIGATISQKFQEASASAKTKIEDRLKDLEMETAVQEVAVRHAHQGKHYLSYFQIGKFRVNGAGPVNEQDETTIENLRPLNDEVVRMLGTAHTTGLNVGIIANYDLNHGRKIAVRADLYFFHDRSPFITANDYVGRIVGMSDAEYAQHKAIGDINSAMLRLLVQNDRWYAYLTAASSSRSHEWYGAGLSYSFTKKLSFVLNTYYGNREEAKKALSAYLSYKVNDRVDIYMGVVVTREAYTPIVSTYGTYDKIEGVVGTSVDLRHNLAFFFSEQRVAVEGYMAKRDYHSPVDRATEEEDDKGVRLSFSARIGVNSSLSDFQAAKASLEEQLARARAKHKPTEKLEAKLAHVHQKIKEILDLRAKHKASLSH